MVIVEPRAPSTVIVPHLLDRRVNHRACGPYASVAIDVLLAAAHMLSVSPVGVRHVAGEIAYCAIRMPAR